MSSLGVTGWAYSEVRNWSDIDIEKSMTLGNPGVNSCINIDHEPKTTTPDAVDATRQSRRRRMAMDSLGVQTVQVLDAIGALDDIIDKIEASIFPVTTDDMENDVLGVDSWVDSDIEITLDSGCVEHVMDLGDAPGYGAFLRQEATEHLPDCRGH